MIRIVRRASEDHRDGATSGGDDQLPEPPRRLAKVTVEPPADPPNTRRGEPAAGTGGVVDVDNSRPTRTEGVGDRALEPAEKRPTVPVDRPGGATVWAPPWDRPATRAPIIPRWLRDRQERRYAAEWLLRHARHVAAFHGTRAPVYAGRALGSAPRGAIRTITGASRWATGADVAPLLAAAVAAKDTKTYIRLVDTQRSAMAGRVAVLLVLAVAVIGGWWGIGLTGWSWVRGPLLFAAVLALGAVGRRRDKPLLDTAVVSPQAQRLTSDVVSKGLAATGLAGLAKPDAVHFVAPIVRDGPGWRAEVDLPDGVIATDVIDRREQLAGGLRRPLGCVWPEAVPTQHPGRLVVWVGDQDMARTKQPAWPLLKTGRVNIFKPWPFGTDVRARVKTLTLIYASGIVGAVPRMGKTFSVRLMLLAASLDPRVEIHAYDLKGTGDFSPLEPVVHRYRAGDDPDDIEYAVADLRELAADMRRRTKVIRELPRTLCPENKVTDDLADVKSYRLHPVLLMADECQRWFEHPEYGKEIESLCDDLVRRGPATGIMAFFATQRPDAKSIPKGISDNSVLRFCLKVVGHTANDMVLGTSAYKAGIRATMFARTDLGIGYLSGEGDDPSIVRTFYIDGPKAETVVARARALREAAGTITGHAAGETFDGDTGPDWSLLADVIAVMGEEKLHSDVLCERLAGRWNRYAGWKPEQLAAALKPLGVQTRQVHTMGTDGGLANRRGVHRSDLLKAAERAGDGGRGR